jgi:hypothetical protein
MTSRRYICVLASTVVVATGIASIHSFAKASPDVSTTATVLVTPRYLYRQALAVARSAGFGSSTNGFGDLGGPSFNELRVPYKYSITAVTLPTGGHEAVGRKITPSQLTRVATYIATVTKHNPIPALPTDG